MAGSSLLTLPVPSRLVLPKGRGSAGLPAISKTVAPMNIKFFMVLETFLTVPEMLRFPK